MRSIDDDMIHRLRIGDLVSEMECARNRKHIPLSCQFDRICPTKTKFPEGAYPAIMVVASKLDPHLAAMHSRDSGVHFPAFVQLPRRVEKGLPYPTLAQEIRDMEPAPARVRVQVIRRFE